MLDGKLDESTTRVSSTVFPVVWRQMEALEKIEKLLREPTELQYGRMDSRLERGMQ